MKHLWQFAKFASAFAAFVGGGRAADSTSPTLHVFSRVKQLLWHAPSSRDGCMETPVLSASRCCGRGNVRFL